MRRGLKLHNRKTTELPNPPRGYILITLMLAVALAAIALLAILPDITQQIRRDREEELRHRGTAYMRAIQHFYKKFGRYPSRIEELENTNQMRFLRKRYKDPITGKDFKIVHPQDITLNSGSLFGQQPGGLQGPGGGPLGPGVGPGAGGGLPGAGGPLGQNNILQPALQGGPNQAGGAGKSPDQDDQEQDQDENTPVNPGTSSSPSPSPTSSSNPAGQAASAGSGLGGQTFGGAAMIGVASVSKKQSIREFDKKNHYNDWFFIYDPTADRGGLLVGPWQSGMSGGLGTQGLGTPVQNMPGARPIGSVQTPPPSSSNQSPGPID